MKKVYLTTVRFRSNPYDNKYKSKPYEYISFEELSPKDLVLVETVHGPVVAKVESVKSTSILEDFPTEEFILEKIDVKQKDNEKEKFNEIRNNVKSLKEEIISASQLEVFSHYAEKNPIIKGLYEGLLGMLNDEENENG